MVSLLGTRRGLYRQLWPASINRILQTLVSRSHLGIGVPTRLLWGLWVLWYVTMWPKGLLSGSAAAFLCPAPSAVFGNRDINSCLSKLTHTLRNKDPFTMRMPHHELIAFRGHLPLISSALWTSLLLFWRRILLWDRRFWWPASYHISKMLSVIFLLLLLLSTITWCFGHQRATTRPPCRHASRLPDPDFASSPAGSTRGPTPPTPLSHPPPCPHHHHDIDIDIDIDVDIAGMLLIRGPKIPFTYR